MSRAYLLPALCVLAASTALSAAAEPLRLAQAGQVIVQPSPGAPVVVQTSPGGTTVQTMPATPVQAPPGTTVAAPPAPQSVLNPAASNPPFVNTASYSGVAAYQPIDFQRGIWGYQTMTPPAGLALIQQGDIIGRAVKDNSGTGFGSVRAALIDPNSGVPHYAVVASPDLGFANHVIIPISAMNSSSGSLVADATNRDLLLMPRYRLGDLQQRYAVAYPRAEAGPLWLSARSELVGRTVTDANGNQIGTIDSVLYAPNTNELRYLIVTGQPFGTSNFVAIPANTARMVDGRVVVADSNFIVYPRAELTQRFRPIQ